MPRITNKHGLPEPLVHAVRFTNYDRGDSDFSITELIKPPRIAALELKHADELEEDASDRLWLLMGAAGHEVLRRSSEGGIVEERCHAEIDGYKISGQIDYAVALKEIIDYKFTSLWAVKEGVKIEWEQQLNAYKWLAVQYGVEVNDIKIVAILRDWSKPEASRDKSYPQSQVVVLPVAVWRTEDVEKWLRFRIKMHVAARSGALPDCTPDEMWERPARFAVMKKGNVRATKVCDTQLEAGQYIASHPKPTDYAVEVRRAERPRCENYCSVSSFCSTFQAWKAQVGA